MDLWRLQHDLLATGRDTLAEAFIHSYLESEQLPSRSLHAAVKQVMERKWLIPWSLFVKPDSPLPAIRFNATSAPMGAFWRALLTISKSHGGEAGSSRLGALVLNTVIALISVPAILPHSPIGILQTLAVTTSAFIVRTFFQHSAAKTRLFPVSA
jgi:hypothetical protein